MNPHRTSPKVLTNAKTLRKNSTLAEAKLWNLLRSHQLQNAHFRRQHPLGPYIADFCAPRQKLVIEVDGGQHLEQEAYDAQRSAFLEARGYRVLRFWNDDLLRNPEAVVAAILDALKPEEPASQPPPKSQSGF
jgi:very-short-patch-repair endonuclease